VGGALPGREPRRGRGAADLDDVTDLSGTDAATAAEAAARRSYGKLVAILAARTGDVAGAEDALSEAFGAALGDWPSKGVPANAEAWLLTVARRRMIDAVRRRVHDEDAAQHFLLLEELAEPADANALPDRRLELLFACAHPGIDRSAHAPLMLQTVLGFDAGTIASAFLISPATMSQRLVRAKTRIRQAGIGFRVPEISELAARLDAVLEAIYAAYAEGWTDAEGADPQRRNLAEEAIWLGRLVASLMPREPEALGLLALMLHAHARRGARRDERGDYVPITSQDTKRWDSAMIDEAETLLHSANALGRPARYQIEAALQSAHNSRRCGVPVPWDAIVGLYDAHYALTASPVTALNRAVASAETDGPEAALASLDSFAGDVRLRDYQPYWAARAELLVRTGATDEARDAYSRAIGLERDPAVRRFLQRRADSVNLQQ
jgi:RNA polymerase sigma-70 factor, ECF subfamily